MPIPTSRIDRRLFIQGVAALASTQPGAIVTGASTFAGEEPGTQSNTQVSLPKLLPLPSAEPFFLWLSERLPGLEPRSPGYEPIRSLLGALLVPQDGRSRFLMPRARTVGRRLTAVWEAAFRSSAERDAFQRHLLSIDGDLLAEIERYQAAQQSEEAYRWQWLRAGFATLQVPQAEVRWPPAEALLTPRRTRAASKGSHPIMGWPASAYQLIQTPHFDIAFQGRGQSSLEVAEFCELTFALWKQLFFAYSQSQKQSDAPGGNQPNHVFQVIVFRSKEAYLSALSNSVRNIALSNGYYSPTQQASLFYLEGNRNFATLVHELTHQFFSEASGQPVVLDSDRSPGFWAVEGVSLYMESLSTRDLGTAFLVDIGGWDSGRLQPGRYRLLHDQVWFPWEEFGNANGLAFRDARDLPQRYSQACGLTHFWLEEKGSSAGFKDLLARLYSRGDANGWMRLSDEELMRSYANFLQTKPFQDSEYLPYTDRNELVLSRCPATADWLLHRLGGRRKWDSIDLSFTETDNTAWLDPSANWDIVRLNLESTKITDEALKGLARMPRLQELDISNCSITSEAIEELRAHPQLQTLWIAGTLVDDQVLDVLREMPKLTTVHASGCRISPSGWSQLMQTVPRLKKNSTGP